MLLSSSAITALSQLQSALEVRSLRLLESESGQPVDLTATVIFPDPPATVFIQDNTAGTFFRLDGEPTPRPGDQVRVRGTTFPGLYLPGIEDAVFEVVGHPGLPEPVPVSFQDLMSGQFHYQRVEIEGIVRAVRQIEEGTGEVLIATGTHKLDVQVKEPTPTDGGSLIGSRVRIHGLAAGEINSRRQLVKPYLRCLSWDDFEILDAALSTDQTPLVTPEDLLTFQVENQDYRQVQLRGIVVAKDRKILYLRSGESAISVELLTRDQDVAIGDEVDILGFPEMEKFSASITDASILGRQAGESNPQAVGISWTDLRSGTWDGNLVSVRGLLGNWHRTEDETKLYLRAGKDKVSVPVHVPGFYKGLIPGMELRVTGVCLVETTRHAQYRSVPDVVSLRSRSHRDIEMLKPPSWWTSSKLAWAMSILATIAFLAGLWIFLLRRQVERQTSALRSGIEQKAALEERQRIAREFHDSLEQDLAGLSLRLDAAATQSVDDKIRSFLDGSRSLVSRIQTETRNLVADLRESPTKLAKLESALIESTKTEAGNVGPEIIVKCDPDIPLLPSRIVHHLKMIAKETITNAIKHAESSEIVLSAQLQNDDLILTIEDNGKGFNVEKESRGKSGHFGCMGMRERARKINANIDWKSDVSGTKVIVNMEMNHE